VARDDSSRGFSRIPRPVWLLLWIVTLAVAFSLSRGSAPDPRHSDVRGAEALREALTTRDALERSYRLSSYLRELGPERLPTAVEVLTEARANVLPEDVRLFMLAWSRFDAPGAFAWARDWPTGWRDTLMNEAMYAWGLRDGSAARLGLAGVSDPARRLRLEGALLDGWLRSDQRASAGAYIALLGQPERRRRLAFALAGEMMRDGTEAVIRWAEEVPDSAPNGFKRTAFQQAIGFVARDDPRRAIRWLDSHRAEPYSAGALSQIVRKWARYHDREGLMAWLRSLPEGDERAGRRDDAIAEGFRIWLREDEDAAVGWLRSALPDGVLDPAVVQLALHLSESSPASAIDWVERIEDPDRRRRSLVRVGRVWRRRDPDALLAWLGESGLPQELQEQIRRGPGVARGGSVRAGVRRVR